MKILITGATGLVGTKLVRRLEDRGHFVSVLVRQQPQKKNEFYWNPAQNEIDKNAFSDIDAIIHLAGANIGKKWTKSHRKAIVSSRIETADLVLNTCKALNTKLKCFISAGGINYYGTFSSDEVLTEETPILHQDFLSSVCQQWENKADEFSSISERVVVLRTAPVLASKGGCLDNIKTITDLHLSAGLGSGQQWFNWIHIDDLVEMYIFALENKTVQGAINAVADEIPTNQNFMKSVAKSRGKLFIPITIPAFLLRFALGEMSEILLEGTRISNKKIKSLGFDFKYKSLTDALQSVNE
ncbi:MAG: TIGR01777 family protein [Flavobacteriales bacterium]|nr:MAG: TIGR01777 family protein [Flavobacteriales bacterium]